jgi:hypothetical protein
MAFISMGGPQAHGHWESHIDPFHSFSREVPARGVAEVGKQGVNAHLVLGREEHKLGFAALQAHRIITPDFHRAKLVTVLRDPITNRDIVTNVQDEQRENGDEEYALHA